MEFFYRGEYTPCRSSGPISAFWKVSFHVAMYALADRFYIKRLGDFAVSRVEESLKHYRLVNGGATGQFPAVLLAIIPQIYESTPDTNCGLRDIVVSHVWLHRNLLTSNTVDKAFKDLYAAQPQFALDLLDKSMNSHCFVCNTQTTGENMCSTCSIRDYLDNRGDNTHEHSGWQGRWEVSDTWGQARSWE